MVYSESESQSPESAYKLTNMSSSMKSPLHNFPLQDLKWSMNQKPNSHRFRIPSQSHKSPYHAGDSSAFAGGNQGAEGVRMGNSLASSDPKTENSSKKSPAAESSDPAENTEKKPKFLIRFRTKTSNPDNGSDLANETKTVDEAADAGVNQSTMAEYLEEPVAKTWNLRPRRFFTKPPNANGGALKIGGAAAQEINVQQHGRLELPGSSNATDGKGAEKKGKEKVKNMTQKFSISLSKEEIEEDIFILTGSKPSRRPKRRTKNVQKQLDTVFPGLWLNNITPDSYKVNEGSAKGK